MSRSDGPVSLDDLAMLVERYRLLAFTWSLVMSGSGLPDGPKKEAILYELNSLIEESAAQAGRLVEQL